MAQFSHFWALMKRLREKLAVSLDSVRHIQTSIRGLAKSYYHFLAAQWVGAIVLFALFAALIQPLLWGQVWLQLFITWVGALTTSRLLRGFGPRRRVIALLRTKLLKSVFARSLDELEPLTRGQWMNRTIEDLEKAEELLIQFLPYMLALATIFTLSALVQWQLIPFFLLAVPVGFWLEQKRAQMLLRKQHVWSELNSTFLENLSGFRTIQTHGAERSFSQRYEKRIAKEIADLHRLDRFNATVYLETIVMLGLGGLLFLWRPDFFTGAGLFSSWFMGVYASKILGMRGSLERVSSELGTLSSMHSRKPSPVERRMEVKQISLRQAFWETAEDWAGPLDWTVRPKESWLVTGPADSGKSSLLEVFAGLRPLAEGVVRLQTVESEHALSRVPVGVCAYVEQFPFVFQGTLRENLTIGTTGLASDRAIWSVLERLDLVDWVLDMGGLDGAIGIRGGELLKSEKYRLAVARALLLDRSFILFDEPFAHFDDRSMVQMIDLIREEKKRRGIIIVSRFIPKLLQVDGVISVTDFETKKAKSWGDVTRIS